MSKYLVIDGDVFLYRFSYANQFKIRWSDECSSEVVRPFEMARDQMEAFIVRLLRRVDCDDYILALSHPLDFRFKVDAAYQSNRKGREAPIHKEALLDYIKEEHPWVMRDWLEGDDILGLMQTEQPGRVVMATIDKDLKQIPGTLYNWSHNTVDEISPAVADMFFFTQVLMGDNTDGIKGIPDVGPKKAQAYLNGYFGKSPEKIWKHVLEVYEQHGLTAEYALQQARLVRILRRGEYDYDRRRPILWKGYQ